MAVLALIWADLGETAATRAASALATRCAAIPACCARSGSGAIALCAAFASGCFFAYLGGAPYVGTEVFGLTSTEVGLLFALTAIGYAAGNFSAGRFSVRWG